MLFNCPAICNFKYQAMYRSRSLHLTYLTPTEFCNVQPSVVSFCKLQFCFKNKRNFTLLQKTGKDQTVAIDKCNKNRTGSSRRKQVRNSKQVTHN